MGRVDIVLPDETFPCEILEWSDDQVRFIVPNSLRQTVGQFSKEEVVVWLKPAQVEQPDPETMIFPSVSGETLYYYSGDEGPRHLCIINSRDLSGGDIGRPEIIENERGLKINFQLIGNRKSDKDLSSSLAIDFNNLDPSTPPVSIDIEDRLPESDFPAGISSVNCPIVIGEELTVSGHDFGRNEGKVDFIFRDGTSYPCKIADGGWSDDSIRCSMTGDMVNSFGRSEQEAFVWVKPARVESPDPGTVISPGVSGETPYYYSGYEGPKKQCNIRPRHDRP